MKRALGAVLLASMALLGACSSGSDVGGCDLPNVSEEYCGEAHRMLLPDVQAPARGNKFAENDDAARLGFSLFFDSNLGNGVSCATCHSPERAFADRLPVSLGKGTGNRNSPTTFNVAYLNVFFWDGRADSLWSQPLIPMENPVEMDSTRLAIGHFVADRYREPYEKVFGVLPDMIDWPADGRPGDAAFDALSEATQTDVNRVFANIGKALEAYMRKNATSRAPLDEFLSGDSSALLGPAQKGLEVFLSNGCADCHSGPMLTDEAFHDVGFPSLPGAPLDTGRAEGVVFLESDPFNLAGRFADREPGEEPAVIAGPTENDLNAFRTPSLRNVSVTFPYGHDGALATLVDVLALHAPGSSPEERTNLLTFFQSLNGEYPQPPWNDWPSPQ